MHRHLERLDNHKVAMVNVVAFLVGFSQASVIYVISSYFAKISGSDNVSIFYLLSYLVILWALLNLHKFVHRMGKARIFIFSSLVKIAFNLMLIAMPFSWWSLFFLVMYVIATGVEYANMDSILETFSVDNMSGKIRGLHLTIINLGFILGPYLSTRLLDRFDFQGVFLFALILNILIFLIALIGFRDIHAVFTKKIRSVEIIVLAIRNKNIFSIYYISFVLEFFYALMIIYTPIYLNEILGFDWHQIGTAFTIMLIPFVILQYPVGILADKKLGEKELLIVAIFIMSAATLFFYFFESANILFWAVVLFSTRIGAALIEILRDSYFYKQIDGRDVDFINFFRSAMPLAYVAAAGISAIMLFFGLSVKSVFLLVCLVVLSALIPAFKLKDSR